MLEETRKLVEKERAITLEVLEMFREIESRRLFAKRGYSSLQEMAIKEFKYSEGAAYRRIAAMRLLKDQPQLTESVRQGEISLTNAATVQTFFRKQKEKIKPEQKKEIIEQIKFASARQCERKLAGILGPRSG